MDAIDFFKGNETWRERLKRATRARERLKILEDAEQKTFQLMRIKKKELELLAELRGHLKDEADKLR